MSLPKNPLNASHDSALVGDSAAARQAPMTEKDVLLYPKPDGSRPIASGFPMEHSPKGT